MSNPENPDEHIARKWLESQFYATIERPRHDPPDYVVDGKFAVEVRRLNRRIEVGGNTEGEENSRKSLYRTIENALKKIESTGNKRSWIVDCEYDFSRRLPNKNDVKDQIRETLLQIIVKFDTPNSFNEYRANDLDYDKHADELGFLNYPHFCLPCGICIEIGELHKTLKDPGFRLQNVSNGVGIAIAPELIRNIQPCINEKSSKVCRSQKLDDYQEWWLILIDHICNLPLSILDSREWQSVRDSIQDRSIWSRIILISSRDINWFHQL